MTFYEMINDLSLALRREKLVIFVAELGKGWKKLRRRATL